MAEQEPPKQVRCLGTLYHSQARLSAGKQPVCAGVKSRVHASLDALPKESVPAAGFKYMCIGLSIYEREQKRPASGEEVVELPACEGLEVISASELLKTPAVLNEGAAGASVSGREGARAAPAQQRPGRSFVPGGGGDAGTEWDAFSDRFWKSSRKVVDRMGSNLSFMGRSAKQAAARLWGSDD